MLLSRHTTAQVSFNLGARLRLRIPRIVLTTAHILFVFEADMNNYGWSLVA